MVLLKGLTEFVNELNLNSIDYGIIGGLAVFAYGGDRTTFDIDFLIHSINREKIKSISQKLNLKIVNENEEVIQFSGAVQIDIVFANRPAAIEMLKNVKKVGKFPFLVVSPEDLIGLKIQAFVGDRSREFIDKGDILTLFRNLPQLNIAKVKEYADIFGVWKELEEIQKLI